MKKIYLFIATVLFSINANAQSPGWQWAKSMGDVGSDAGNSVVVDGNGNVYTTGTFVATVDFDPGVGIFQLTSVDPTVIDAFVSKSDSAGNFIWAKSFGGSDMDAGRSIVFDSSGSGAVYFAGNFRGTADFDPNAGGFNLISTSTGINDIFISKLDTAGNLLWAKGMGGSEDDVAYSLSIDPSGSGNVYCIGTFRSTADFDPNAGTVNLTSAGNTDIFVSKYNSSGNLVWARQMGGTAADWALFTAKCPSGTDVYTTGYFSGSGDFDPGTGVATLTSAGLDDVFISKLDSSGNFVWAKSLGGANGDYGSSIATDVAGNVYTTGHFQVMADFDPGIASYPLTSVGSDDIFVSKLDNAGNFVWAKAFGGGTYDTGNDIVVDYSGNVYTVGGFLGTVDFDPGAGSANLTAAGNVDIFISSLDATGNFNWAKQTGGNNGDNCRAIVLDPSGQFTMTGSFSSNTLIFGPSTLPNLGQSDIFIARLDTIITTGIETISTDQFPIHIFPNPFTDELTVNSTMQGEIKIYDICGRIVYTETLSSFSTHQITANWQKGIYFVEVITDEGRVVRKVVKQ